MEATDFVKINAILWASLEKAAGTRGKGTREHLVAGSKTPVDLTVSGTVGKTLVGCTLSGDLTVSHDGTFQSTKSVDPIYLLAYALALMPKTRRQVVLSELPTQFASTGELPEVDQAAAAALLPKLSTKVTKPKSGAVSFVFPVDTEAAVLPGKRAA